ncbi:hypothetical protein ACFWXK_14225 [Streptomyces sp. NPDC059070]|uniref:hypothetical protein n=1 Tax=Streptomyces sp. NPDC059070 TaxID=3346713 RepID=UPI0036CD8D75
MPGQNCALQLPPVQCLQECSSRRPRIGRHADYDTGQALNGDSTAPVEMQYDVGGLSRNLLNRIARHVP